MNFIKQRQQLAALLKEEGITDTTVLDVLAVVPRELFIPSEQRFRAYENVALPLSHGQTISQPYTVAFMLQLLAVSSGDHVLEIGTGSGYNAALLSKLVGSKGSVISLEVVPDLAEHARHVLAKLGCANVRIIVNDGSVGYASAAPYQRIIVTAAAPSANKEWLTQLVDGGILVAPVGTFTQKMLQITKHGKRFIEKDFGYYQFVPLVGKKGFSIVI